MDDKRHAEDGRAPTTEAELCTPDWLGGFQPADARPGIASPSRFGSAMVARADLTAHHDVQEATVAQRRVFWEYCETRRGNAGIYRV